MSIQNFRVDNKVKLSNSVDMTDAEIRIIKQGDYAGQISAIVLHRDLPIRVYFPDLGLVHWFDFDDLVKVK